MAILLTSLLLFLRQTVLYLDVPPKPHALVLVGGHFWSLLDLPRVILRLGLCGTNLAPLTGISIVLMWPNRFIENRSPNLGVGTTQDACSLHVIKGKGSLPAAAASMPPGCSAMDCFLL